MVKAKSKADRAAARQAINAPLADALALLGAAPEVTATVEDPVLAEASMAETPQQTDEPVPAPPPDRTEMLRSKPEVVGRFMHLTVPILIDVYAASVITPVRIKTLTGLLKAVSFLDADGLKRVLSVSSSIIPSCCPRS